MTLSTLRYEDVRERRARTMRHREGSRAVRGDVRQSWRIWWDSACHYLAAAVLCAVFSAVYESLSHGVISVWMVGLCGFPLLLGAVPALLCAVLSLPAGRLVRELWACGVMTLAMGSCLRGVLEIYGTASDLLWPYAPVGVVLLGTAVLAEILMLVRRGSAR